MEGKGGMPSLRETVAGHLRAGHDIHLILPQYNLFSDDLTPLTIRWDQGYTINVATCKWLRWIKRLRKGVRTLSGGTSVLYPARWLLNVTMLLCLTFSLYREAFRVYRKGFVPDLIYAHNQYAALAGYLLRIVWHKPNVTRLYGTFLADLMIKPFVTLRYPTATAGYIVPSSLLICANDGTRGDDVARKFKIPDKRFRFWQNGVTPPSTHTRVSRRDLVNRFESNLRVHSKWIISCSRLSYWKRIDRMIRALRVCIDKKNDCQLLVAGDGPELPRLKNLADELDVSKYLVWLGALAHDDIWSLMKAADIFMITNDVTNRCNPLYEAAWAGLPVVSVYDPSTDDLLKHRVNALLAHKEDFISLGENLAELCNNTALAYGLKDGQKNLAASFWTWEERMRTEATELEKLVGRDKIDRMKQ
jgi:glycosyltransferase involved in cell wall biosynthesis